MKSNGIGTGTGKIYGRPFIALASLLILAFIMGGGARGDIASLVLLRPIAALLLGAGLLTIDVQGVARYRFLFCMAGAIIALALMHLVPLPPAIWTLLPGRNLVAQIDQAAGLAPIWRPIDLVPSGGWNALFALIIPAAALLLGVQLNASEQSALVGIVVAIGLVSALVAVLQLTGAQDNFYLYRVTNLGAGVGLFANRNHQAVFLALMFPLIATLAFKSTGSISEDRLRIGISFAGMLVLLPLIMVTGSRAGLITGFLGLVSVPFLWWSSGMSRGTGRFLPQRQSFWVAGVLGILLLAGGLAAFILGRAEAVDRLSLSSAIQDLRFQALGPVADLAWLYFPFGSGIGSFPEVFQINEPYRLLDLRFFNHAHNDWLETVMTAGFPALLLLGIAITAFARVAFKWFRAPAGRQKLLAGAGLWVILIMAIASATDYPLRVPSLACLFVIAAIWANARGVSDSLAQEK